MQRYNFYVTVLCTTIAFLRKPYLQINWLTRSNRAKFIENNFWYQTWVNSRFLCTVSISPPPAQCSTQATLSISPSGKATALSSNSATSSRCATISTTVAQRKTAHIGANAPHPRRLHLQSERFRGVFVIRLFAIC